MAKFFDEIDGEGRFWLCMWSMALVAVTIVTASACIYCTATEINNPNPHKWDRAQPTVKARLVPDGQ